MSCPEYPTDRETNPATPPLRRVQTEPIFPTSAGFKRGPPSYWIGCSYRYFPVSNKLDITIRHTGVPSTIANYKSFSKLTLEIKLSPNQSKKHTITLMNSQKDYTFKSHHLQFEGVTVVALKSSGLEMKLCAHKNVFIKKVRERWIVPMDNCDIIHPRTDWKKCENL